jgi:GNAT superfamily N-acetyltransferase
VRPAAAMEHIIRQYSLEEGALEVQYIEENFSEFRKKKAADEIISRMADREFLILLSMAPVEEGSDELIPVSFKVGHELRERESQAALVELVHQLSGCVDISNHRIFYSWIGGTRREWRAKGHYRALTEQQEEWAHDRGYHELVVKTKNRFYPMRATLDHLEFNVVKYQPDLEDNRESKLFLSKRIGAQLLKRHRTARTVSDTV